MNHAIHLKNKGKCKKKDHFRLKTITNDRGEETFRGKKKSGVRLLMKKRGREISGRRQLFSPMEQDSRARDREGEKKK